MATTSPYFVVRNGLRRIMPSVIDLTGSESSSSSSSDDEDAQLLEALLATEAIESQRSNAAAAATKRTHASSNQHSPSNDDDDDDAAPKRLAIEHDPRYPYVPLGAPERCMRTYNALIKSASVATVARHVPHVFACMGMWERVASYLSTPALRSLNETCSTLWFATERLLRARLAWGAYHPSVLSEEQLALADLVLGERLMNVFITGGAGSGKSFLFNYIIAQLEHAGRLVCVCAPTGKAALEVRGGRTIHTLFGLSPTTPLDRVPRHPPSTASELAEMQVLMIDEVSMVSSEMLDFLDMLLRSVRQEPTRPFGGVQVVLCGDFFQLPPVSKVVAAPRTSTPAPAPAQSPHPSTQFCFLSRAWTQLFADPATSRQVQLRLALRQRDRALVWALHCVRHGQSESQFVRAYFASLSGQRYERGVAVTRPINERAVRLFATNAEVERTNAEYLQRLDARSERKYEAREFGDVTALRACRVPTSLVLRKGARVLLARNYDVRRGLVNGMGGTIVDFVPMSGAITASAAIACIVDEAHVTPQTRHASVLYRCAQLAHNERYASMPWVPLVECDNGARAYVLPYLFAVEEARRRRKSRAREIEAEAEERFKAGRLQLPMRLGWALTIHNGQGGTFPYVDVDLARVFECGHGYVALSRVRYGANMVVRNMNWQRIRAHPDVLAYQLRTFGPIAPVPDDVLRSVLQPSLSK